MLYEEAAANFRCRVRGDGRNLEICAYCTNEITDRLAKVKEWSPKTIYTMLSRLEKKGVIVHEKESRVFVYTPCVRKEDYIEAESRTLANRFFDGAMSQMVVNFLDQRDLSSEDLDELQCILDKKRKK